MTCSRFLGSDIAWLGVLLLLYCSVIFGNILIHYVSLFSKSRFDNTRFKLLAKKAQLHDEIGKCSLVNNINTRGILLYLII